MNKIMIIGNVVHSPKMRATNNGKSVGNFSVAVKRSFKNASGEYETDFFEVQVFGKLAEVCEKYVEKGKKVAVTGAMQSREYEKDGVKRRIWELFADEVEFLTPKGEGAPAQSEPANKASEPKFTQADDAELPF